MLNVEKNAYSLQNYLLKQLNYDINDLSLLGLDATEFNARLKLLIKNSYEKIKKQQYKFFEVQGSFEVNKVTGELSVVNSATSAYKPIITSQLFERSLKIRSTGLDKIGGRLYKDVRTSYALYLSKFNDMNKLEELITQALANQNQYAKTITNTFVAGVDNLHVAKRAEEQNGKSQLMKMVGPTPEREFCKKYYNEIKTIAEWSRLDNGQGLDVLTNCGGYNCRHHFIIIHEKKKK